MCISVAVSGKVFIFSPLIIANSIKQKSPCITVKMRKVQVKCGDEWRFRRTRGSSFTIIVIIFTLRDPRMKNNSQKHPETLQH